MDFSTAKSATSGGRVLMYGASLEPVRLVVACLHNQISAFIFLIQSDCSGRCTTSSSAGSVRWALTPTEWNLSCARYVNLTETL